MTLRRKLLLLLLVTAAVPALVTGLLAWRGAVQALTSAVTGQHLRRARAEAEHVVTSLRSLAQGLSDALRHTDPSTLSAEEARQLLSHLYLRRDRISLVGLFDAQARMTASVFIEDREAAAQLGPQYPLHDVVAPQEVEDFQRRARELLTRAPAGRMYTFSEPYVTAVRGRPALLVVAHSPFGQGMSLVVELGLEELSQRLAADGQSEDRVFLLDGAGRLVLGGDAERERRQESYSARLPGVLGARREGSARYEEEGRDWLAAYSPVPELGWVAVAARPREAALAPLRTLLHTLSWVIAAAAVGVLALTLLVYRSLSQPIAQLAGGARRIAEGHLDHRITLERSDELGEVAHAFNEMGRSLENAHRELLRFNGRLLEAVDERTQELKQAQEQLLRSQRVAAVGDLAAGMAHEMNTPLSVITANLQLLLAEESSESSTRPMLAAAHRQAVRMAEIIRELRALEARQRGELSPLDLHPVVERALHARLQELDTAGVHVVRRFHAGQAVVLGDSKALDDVFHRLLGNALSALEGRPERRITLATHVIQGSAVRVELSDTGRGIPREHLDRLFNPFFTTKRQWSDKGLSLAVCHRVIEVHGGKISIQSHEGQGTTVIIELPTAPPPPLAEA